MRPSEAHATLYSKALSMLSSLNMAELSNLSSLNVLITRAQENDDDDNAPENQGVVRKWHKTVTDNLRHNLVRNIISSVLSPPGLPAVEDSDIRSKVFYLIVVEDAIYEFATSRDEYFSFMAEKYLEMKKICDDARQKQKEEQEQHEPQKQ